MRFDFFVYTGTLHYCDNGKDSHTVLGSVCAILGSVEEPCAFYADPGSSQKSGCRSYPAQRNM